LAGLIAVGCLLGLLKIRQSGYGFATPTGSPTTLLFLLFTLGKMLLQNKHTPIWMKLQEIFKSVARNSASTPG